MGNCAGRNFEIRAKNRGPRPRGREGSPWRGRGYLCSTDALVGPSCDNWNFNASNPCLYVGGNYGQNGNHGLFYVNYNTASNTSSNIGSRHLFADPRKRDVWDLLTILNYSRHR